MADVRSLLKNERAYRRIQHKHASYSTTGTLLCLVCHLHLKSETLWEGHLRSAGHLMRLQKLQDQEREPSPSTNAEEQPAISSKKRKASDDVEEDTIRKRSRAANGLPEDFFDAGKEESAPATFPTEMQIPSRPATPLKPPEALTISQRELQVDEDEWAAFESDIATAEAQVAAANDAVISAPAIPAISASDLAKKSAEEDYAQKKERQEAELEGDKEDAARKMEEELEEMETLEARVRKLREKREELRRAGNTVSSSRPTTQATVGDILEEEDGDDEEDDDWDGWMKA